MTTKRKILVTLFLTLASAFGAANAQSWPPIGMDGDGSQGDPWQITLPSHLADLAAFVNASTANANATSGKYYKLMNNIDLSGYAVWTAIGKLYYGDDYVFKGNFNGNGKVVQNPTFDGFNSSSGLFGTLLNAVIENLGVINCNQTSGYNSYIGCLAGRVINSTITNCYTTGNIGNGDYLGGLVAQTTNGTIITNCYSTVNIDTIGSFGGGLVADAQNTTITNCYATGNISNGYNSGHGGLVGAAQNGTTITNCYATGNIDGGSCNGGLIGNIWSDIAVSVTNCYATGNVSGIEYIGGLIGHAQYSNGIIRNCVAANNSLICSTTFPINRICSNGVGTFENNYALNTMLVQDGNGNVNVGDGYSEAGAGKPFSTLIGSAFYSTGSNWYNNEAWNIAEPSGVWKACSAGFPLLRWSNLPCPTFNPVTNITGVPKTATVTVPLTLTGTVVPSNATNQTITWSVQSAGTTGASITDDNILNTTASGTCVVLATVVNGLSPTQNYTQQCTINVNKATQTAPAAPTLASKTAQSITLATVNGCEYNIVGDSTFQSSPTFSGLTPNTSYSFRQRMAETATHFVSPASTTATFTTVLVAYDTIYGCNDYKALNYNPDATADDGSCEYAAEENTFTPEITVTPVDTVGARAQEDCQLSVGSRITSVTITGITPLGGNKITVHWKIVQDGTPVTYDVEYTITKEGINLFYLSIICTDAVRSGSLRSEITENGHTVSATYDVKFGAVGVCSPVATNISIYPNPTTGIVHIGTQAEIKVYSLQGVLLQGTFGTQVNLSAYPQGVYQLQVNGETVKVVKK